MTKPDPVILAKIRAETADAITRWGDFLVAHGLRYAPFKINTPGDHDDNTAVFVGMHVELLLERGFSVLSHSVTVENYASPIGPQRMTVTSLLVGQPRIGPVH